MTDYRLYLLKDGDIARAQDLEADSDADAISEADALRANQAAEHWQRARVVRTFEGVMGIEFSATRANLNPEAGGTTAGA